MILEPKMKLLHQVVIPSVAVEWKKIADFLELEVSLTEEIEKKHKNDPINCCEEVFREWLRTDYGLQPKTWSTLTTTLKEIKQLVSSVQRIEQMLKSNRFNFI